MNIKLMTKTYSYKTAEPDRNKYGEIVWPADSIGVIDMAIYLHTLTVYDDIKFQDADYIGLTNDNINDLYIINYDGVDLKVMYVNPFGRYTLVFMKKK